MKIKKADDYQSWYINQDDVALLIDPWFDSSLVAVSYTHLRAHETG